MKCVYVKIIEGRIIDGDDARRRKIMSFLAPLEERNFSNKNSKRIILALVLIFLLFPLQKKPIELIGEFNENGSPVCKHTRSLSLDTIL